MSTRLKLDARKHSALIERSLREVSAGSGG